MLRNGWFQGKLHHHTQTCKLFTQFRQRAATNCAQGFVGWNLNDVDVWKLQNEAVMRRRQRLRCQDVVLIPELFVGFVV